MLVCEGRNDAARWRQGDNVLLRHVGSAKTYVWPHTVVRDEGDVVLMYIPEGTKILRARTGGSPPELMPSFTSKMDVLRVLDVTLRYSVWLVWVAAMGTPSYWPHFEGPNRFRGWKADIHSLPVRTDFAFDYTDDSLDLIVTPDRELLSKDEAHFQMLVDAGVYSMSEAREIYRVYGQADQAAKERHFPFDVSLVDWRPFPSWTIPTAPADSVSYGDIETNLTTGWPFDPRF